LSIWLLLLHKTNAINIIKPIVKIVVVGVVIPLNIRIIPLLIELMLMVKYIFVGFQKRKIISKKTLTLNYHICLNRSLIYDWIACIPVSDWVESAVQNEWFRIGFRSHWLIKVTHDAFLQIFVNYSHIRRLFRKKSW
jgi:hypothetical protein